MDGVEVPVCWAEYYINRDFAAVGRLLQRHAGPIFPLIEDLFGQRIVEVHQEIGATDLDGAGAAAQGEGRHGGARGAALVHADDGGVAQVTISTHPASRFRHSMTMRRVKA